MKFIHIADVHLGAKPDITKSWGEKRSREIWQTFEEVVSEAEESQVDILLIAGDLFHEQPTLKILEEVNYIFSKLKNTQVVLIAGNHDYVKNNLYYYDFEWNENVHFLKERDITSVYFENINTKIYGLSYDRQEITDRLYDDVQPDSRDTINILLGHGGDDKHIPVTRKLLVHNGFDYAAFGHIHKPEVDIENHFAYAGSLEPIDHTEECEHGYIYGEITKENISLIFVPLSKRTYERLELDITECGTFTQIKDLITEQIELRGRHNIFKVVLTGTKSVQMDPAEEEMLHYLGNVHGIEDLTVPDYDIQELKKKNANNLIGHFIDKLSAKDDEVSRKALEYGLKALINSKNDKC